MPSRPENPLRAQFDSLAFLDKLFFPQPYDPIRWLLRDLRIGHESRPDNGGVVLTHRAECGARFVALLLTLALTFDI